MSWRNNERLTQTACEVFKGVKGPMKVLDNGRQHYYLPRSPVGEMELFKTAQGFLAAAEDPPSPRLDPDELPEDIRHHLALNGLQPWRLVKTDDCGEAIRALGDAEGLEGIDDDPAWCPYMMTVAPRGPLVGERRQRLSERLAALLAVHPPGGPAVQLVGIDGIGKRTLVSDAAERSRLRLRGEIPLRRLVFDGVLDSGVEKIMRFFADAEQALGRDDLLLISDAHVLDVASFEQPVRDEIILRELAQLPCAYVLTTPRRPLPARNVVALPCPGLESIGEVRQVVEATYGRGRLCCEEPALSMLAGHASVPDQGIVPGRLLYLVDVATALLTQDPQAGDVCDETASPPCSQGTDEADDKPIVLTPDDIIAAASMVSDAWA